MGPENKLPDRTAKKHKTAQGVSTLVRNQYSPVVLPFFPLPCNVTDPDPVGSAFNLSPGSGSAFEIRIQMLYKLVWRYKFNSN